jgi:phage N-6-adenine-methyltransferase
VIVGRKGRNHPHTVTALGVDDSIDDRRTPAGLWREQNARWDFQLDAAASPANAKCRRFYTRAEDGLNLPWRPPGNVRGIGAGYRTWCNPPYSNIAPWVEKAWLELRAGCPLVVMLLPATRTELDWWQDLVEPHRDTDTAVDGIYLRAQFLRGRHRFGRPAGHAYTHDRPPFGLVLLTWKREDAWMIPR